LSEQKIQSLLAQLAQGDIKSLAKLLSKNLGDFEFVATNTIKSISQSIRTHFGEEAASAYVDEVIRGVIETVENRIKEDPQRVPGLEQIAEVFRRKLSDGIDYTDEFIRCGMRRG
jgi:hypothetical protein